MAQVFVKYNPYRLETTLLVNGREVTQDSEMYKLTKGKRLQEWIGNFPQMLREALNVSTMTLEFHGLPLDWDDFEEAFLQAQEAGIVNIVGMKFVAGKHDDTINERIVQVFKDLQEGPLPEFRDPKLKKAFDNVNDAVFPVNVIATMSSGKSTLINALLGNRLMPSKNEACTATITQILDADDPDFPAIVYGPNNSVIKRLPNLTYEEMCVLNDNPEVQQIYTEGEIPFLDSNDMALMLVDTPGPNNSQNQAHQVVTYKAIGSNSNNLILYVLNGTQLSTNDDSNLLRYVAEQIQKGGKQVRDRFLFVINKMDQYNPDEECIADVISAAKRYLSGYGIEDPQLFPCSAFTALNIRTTLADVDVDNLTRAQERQLPIAARDTISMIDKFMDYEMMHLEQYTTLSPSAKQDLEARLQRAIDNHDTKEQALIHSGICSIEAAITAYVKKYAKTKKVKDLVESFQELLESSQVLVRAKNQVATDQAAAQACAARAKEVRKRIADGKEAEAFKKRINALNPMPKLTKEAEKHREQAVEKVRKVFRPYGDMITNQEEAKRLVQQFSISSQDALAELVAEVEKLINESIVQTGEQMLREYTEKLTRFDEAAGGGELDFQTVDLIKGALRSLCDNAEEWTSEEFATATVDCYGHATTEERIYYEKVGQEEERVVVGSHQEKIGTRKIAKGTEQVLNPEKRWWKFFTPKYVTRTKYVNEDVYETVLDYETVLRDVFEERVEIIEKFEVETGKLTGALLSRLRADLEEGIEKTLKLADQQVQALKDQFTRSFDQLDAMIAEKYTELEACAKAESESQEKLKENQGILAWLEQCMKEVDELLEL